MRKKQQRSLLALAICAAAICVIVAVADTTLEQSSLPMGTLPAMGQEARQPWQQTYDRLPDFPKENNYVNRETGETDLENTLARRLIEYHSVVKRRPAFFRLDWKLTLADYLGANEAIAPEKYPGNSILSENPLEGDRAAIAKLSREERETLVMTLVALFNPNYGRNISEPSQTPDAVPDSFPSAPPPLPKPGDADLLQF